MTGKGFLPSDNGMGSLNTDAVSSSLKSPVNSPGAQLTENASTSGRSGQV